MNLAVWAERNGVAWVIAYRWFRAGLLPVPAQRVGRLILVNDPAVEESGRGRTLVYARVSSADQRSDLDRRVARVTAWATSQHLSVDKVVCTQSTRPSWMPVSSRSARIPIASR